MAIFDRFRRKRQDNTDIEEYYDQPKRRNAIISILLGIVSFLITLALLWLLFLGGRWVYRQVMDDDNKKQTSSSQNQDDQSQSNASKDEVKDEQSGNSSGGNETSSTSTNQPRPGASGVTGSQGGSSATGGQPGAGTTTQTPATGDSLPRTGDEGM